ncbi:MAG TPA: hypothetical protein VEG60_23505 [Candidatus Binatia bacterium]|nr:hypothetical protein [Candidatus Binatia bacterium]
MRRHSAHQTVLQSTTSELFAAIVAGLHAPLVFNSIKAGEEIMRQIEAIRRQRSVSSDKTRSVFSLYTDTRLAGLGARYCPEGGYNPLVGSRPV